MRKTLLDSFNISNELKKLSVDDNGKDEVAIAKSLLHNSISPTIKEK